MSGRAESHEHNGPDGPSNDRTGNNAVNTPETPGTSTPGTPTPGDTPSAPDPAEPTRSQDAPARSAPGRDDTAGTPEATEAPTTTGDDTARDDITGDDTVQGRTAGDGAVRDGTTRDDLPQDDIVRGDTPQNSTTRDGTAGGDAPQGDISQGGTAGDGAVREGISQSGTAGDGAVRDGISQSGTAGGGTTRGNTAGDGGSQDGDPGDATGGLGGVLDLGGDGLGGDELALRRLLHGAVEGLEPSTGALDHLRRAVPARRARKRQALVGAAAAVILLGTGVPAFVHVAASDGASDANPVNAGHGSQVQGGTGDETGGPAGERAAGSPSGELGAGKDSTDPTRTPPTAGTSASAGADGTPDLTTSAPAALPACGAGQLGVSVADAGAPGGDGTVYGTFRITNISSGDCAVDTAGTVGFATSGAADPGRISVIRHTGGGAASGLPDPSTAVGSLVLKPSGAYEVRFAWVPSETCPVNGGGGDGNGDSGGSGSGGDGGDGGGEGQPPEPTPSTPSEEPPPATGDTATGTAEGVADTGTAAVEPQLKREEGVADGSVTVTHTPGAGGPQAAATIPHACAGTIYRTGLLPVQ
ncbi:hypothetical protein RND61_10495 [Streptomyces sp. TRM76323]|uniref:DUF4232 domain-containing protein n=1 Tax=Streptomyces tamarix TaxID=3078565 RepID=A0ABU3QIB1_9ACTN|nr:hypothetical protein [Streptomyces tamarix]MDT9682495.1 hypothetical protein [Streptomyces tamarix]